MKGISWKKQMICHGKVVPYRHLVEKTQTARWDKKSNALFKKIIGRKMLETRFLAMWQTGVTTNRMFLILIHFSTSLRTHRNTTNPNTDVYFLRSPSPP